ncbi:MAG: dockerin type I repeat-containing protein [Clostridia bacterium]|nr:dockerin type I repeat-containing protein [Clostridia bacterium]
MVKKYWLPLLTAGALAMFLIIAWCLPAYAATVSFTPTDDLATCFSASAENTKNSSCGEVTQSGNQITIKAAYYVDDSCTNKNAQTTTTLQLTVKSPCMFSYSVEEGNLSNSDAPTTENSYYAVGDVITFEVQSPSSEGDSRVIITFAVTPVSALTSPNGEAQYMAYKSNGVKQPFIYIDQAVEFTKQNDGTYNGTIIVTASGKMVHSEGNTTFEIPAGVTLLLPREPGETAVNGEDADLPFANYGFWNDDSRYAMNATDTNFRYLLLTIPKGTTVKNNGHIILGGMLASRDAYFATGTYAQTYYKESGNHVYVGRRHSDISLLGTIEMGDNSVLSSIGFIMGEGTIKTTGTGAAIYQPFVVADYRGGNYLAASIAKILQGFTGYGLDTKTGEEFIAPFLRYTMFNIRSKMEITGGNSLRGYTLFYTSQATAKNTVTVIGSESEKGFMNLKNGAKVTIEYKDTNKVQHLDTWKKYIKGTNESTSNTGSWADGGWGYNHIGRTVWTVEGGAEFAAMKLSMQVTTNVKEVDFAKTTFPVPYNYKIELKNGDYSILNSMMLLPGAEMIVGNGSTLTIGDGTTDMRFMVMDGLFDHNSGGDDKDGISKQYLRTHEYGYYPDFTYPKTGELQIAGLSGTGVLKLEGTAKLIVNNKVDFGGLVQTTGGSTIEFNGNPSCTNQIGIVGKPSSLNYYFMGATVRTLPARLMGSDGKYFTMQTGKTYLGSAGTNYITEYEYTIYNSSTDVSSTIDRTGANSDKASSVLTEANIKNIKKGSTWYDDNVKAAGFDLGCTCASDPRGATHGHWCNYYAPISVAGEWQEFTCTHEGTTVTDAAVNATCTEPGLTEGSHCTACGTVIVAQEVVPATGHSMGDWTVDTEATCDVAGSQHKDCANCDYKEYGEIPAPGHSYDEGAVTTAPTCDGAGVKTYTCTTCSSTKTEDVANLGHTNAAAVEENRVEATCSAAGSYDSVVYCSVCGKEVSRTSQTIEKKAHTEVTDAAVAPDCVNTGLTEGKHCSVCGTVTAAQQVVPANSHTYGDPVVTDATCTVDGSKLYTCSACPDGVEGHTKTEVIPAIGHSMKQTAEEVAPTCTEPGKTAVLTCANGCGKTEGGEAVPAMGHSEVSVPGKEPTCTETGLTDGVKCSTCGTIMTAQEEISALGHTSGETVVENNVAADCENAGSYDNVVYCTVCKAEVSRETKTVEANGHTEETIPAVDATCTEPGLTAGVKCAVCGEILTAQEEISAKGHTEVVDAAVEATCTVAGKTEGKHCSVCNEVLVEQEEVAAKGHSDEIIPGVEATCTTAGSTEGLKCSVCGTVTTPVNVIPAFGHTEVTDAAVEPDCINTGLTEGKHCSACGEILVAQETVDAKGHTEVEIPAVGATCTETGLTAGVKCSVCGEILTAQQEVAVSGHSYDAVVTAPTCANTGYTTYTCSECGDNYTDNIVATTEHSYTSYVSLGGGLERAECDYGCGSTDTRADESHEGENVEIATDNTDESNADVTIDTELLEDIKNKNFGLFMSGNFVDLMFNNTALNQIITDIAAGKSNVTVVVSETTPADVTDRLVFEFHLEADGQKIDHSDFGDGEVTVTIPLNELNLNNKQTVKVFYLYDDTRVEMPAEVKDGKVSFKTNHFSEYEIQVVDVEAETTVTVSSSTVAGSDKTDTLTEGVTLETVIANNDDGSYTLSITPKKDGVDFTTKMVYLIKCTNADTTVSTAVKTDGGWILPEGTVSVTIEATVLGDVTGDGKILPGDYSKIKAFILGKFSLEQLGELSALAADVTKDGSILPGDYNKVKAFILNRITTL